jgi:hypothetical protein
VGGGKSTNNDVGSLGSLSECSYLEQGAVRGGAVSRI